MARRKTDEATSLLLGEAVSRSKEAGADRAPSLERRRFYADWLEWIDRQLDREWIDRQLERKGLPQLPQLGGDSSKERHARAGSADHCAGDPAAVGGAAAASSAAPPATVLLTLTLTLTLTLPLSLPYP